MNDLQKSLIQHLTWRACMGEHRGGSWCCIRKIAPCWKFAQEHWDVPQKKSQNILRTDETKVELCLWKLCMVENGTAHSHQNLVPAVWYCGGSVSGLILCCLRAWAAFCHQRIKLQTSLSRYFSEEMKTFVTARLGCGGMTS